MAKLENVKCLAKILIPALNDLDVEIDFYFQLLGGTIKCRGWNGICIQLMGEDVLSDLCLC